MKNPKYDSKNESKCLGILMWMTGFYWEMTWLVSFLMEIPQNEETKQLQECIDGNWKKSARWCILKWQLVTHVRTWPSDRPKNRPHNPSRCVRRGPADTGTGPWTSHTAPTPHRARHTRTPHSPSRWPISSGSPYSGHRSGPARWASRRTGPWPGRSRHPTGPCPGRRRCTDDNSAASHPQNNPHCSAHSEIPQCWRDNAGIPRCWGHSCRAPLAQYCCCTRRASMFPLKPTKKVNLTWLPYIFHLQSVYFLFTNGHFPCRYLLHELQHYQR